MIRNESRRSFFGVLIATGVVVVLAGLLAVRVTEGARATDAAGSAARADVPAPPAATVPEPEPWILADLPTPFCWGCSWNQDAPLEFQVDLDLLAPLGDGGANAAVWFKDFAGGGSRESDAERRVERRIERTIGGQPWNVLAADDPLLLEAEPWIDQASCRFYPDIFEIEGMNTRIPNLLMMLDLARSWVARGKLADDPRTALEDFRRAIRLGRLLRQDDVTIIQDLVAIACIRLGAEALYELSREEGDAATMVATALVLTDKDVMRLNTMRKLSVSDRAIEIEDADSPEPSLLVVDAALDAVIEYVRENEDRRFRLEGLITLQIAHSFGTPAQQQVARTALDEFAQAPDALFAAAAQYARDVTLDREVVRSLAAGTSTYR